MLYEVITSNRSSATLLGANSAFAPTVSIHCPDGGLAALMGIDVDGVISKTFIISGILAGAAGVMWGVHNGLT